jgi:hypothetical protein
MALEEKEEEHDRRVQDETTRLTALAKAAQAEAVAAAVAAAVASAQTEQVR